MSLGLPRAAAGSTGTRTGEYKYRMARTEPLPEVTAVSLLQEVGAQTLKCAAVRLVHWSYSQHKRPALLRAH